MKFLGPAFILQYINILLSECDVTAFTVKHWNYSESLL
jgi:hypothetical protein